jgi:cyclopropane fatty-acyl-phospholipid synthase-like methyltransferase
VGSLAIDATATLAMMRVSAAGRVRRTFDTNSWHVGDRAGLRAAQQQAIVAYYDYTTPFYRIFWHGDTGAIHYGLNDPWTKNANDELLNTNRLLAKVARITRRSTVLDAGCGIGGSAVWIASHIGAEVVALTLSERQAKLAIERATRDGVADRVVVLQRDYETTKLPAASFDVVWAIESACYAPDKRRFLTEAFRVLKPGGRLVVADGFLNRQPRRGLEAAAYETFVNGLALCNLSLIRPFLGDLQTAGFTRIRRWDKTRAAMPSSERLFRRCLLGYPVALVTEAARITPALLTENIRAGIVQRALVTRGVMTYSVVYAEKPSPSKVSSPKRRDR